MKYYAHIYSRHCGRHKKWWYQNRNKNFPIPIQVEHSSILKANAEHMAVYIRCQIDDLSGVSKDLLRYIGGQTHIICGKDKLPMIPVTDSKANFIAVKTNTLDALILSAVFVFVINVLRTMI